MTQSVVGQWTTNAAGRFVTMLPAGDYDVKFEHAGYSPLTVTGVSLHVNDRLRIDGVLSRGGGDTVRAFSNAERVQRSPAVQSLIDLVELQELPLINRNFVQLVPLTPGVSSGLPDEVETIQLLFGGSSRLTLSLHGGRPGAVAWLVDGVTHVDVLNNSTLFMTPSLDSIKEIRVITSGAAAEWSRAGGIVNVVTRSGGRRLSGSVYEFFRNDKLNANSFFRNASTSPEIRDSPPRLRYNNFGYTIGGPASGQRRNLLFFFSHEWRLASQQEVRTTMRVPDPAWLTDTGSVNYVPPADRDPNAVKLLAAWPAPNVPGTNLFERLDADTTRDRQEVLRLDYQARSNWRMTGRYGHDLNEKIDPLIIAPQQKPGRTSMSSHIVTGQLSGSLGPGFNELSYRFARNDISQKNGAGTTTTRSEYGVEIAEVFAGNEDAVIPWINMPDVDPVAVFRAQAYDYRQHSIANNFVLQRGNHTFKSGLLFTFDRKDGDFSEDATQGSFTFRAGGRLTGFQNFLRGNRDGRCGPEFCTYAEDDTNIVNRLRFDTYEAYAQDTWQLRTNLTLDLGLRYSIATPITDDNDLLMTFAPDAFNPARAPAFADPFGATTVAGTGDPFNGIVLAAKTSPHGRSLYARDTNNVQPRLGVAWNPRQDSRTIVRGGYGVYFAPPPVGIFMQNTQTGFVSLSPFQTRISIANPSLADPSRGSVVRPGQNPVAPLYATNGRFVTPRIQQWNLGFERTVYSRGVIEAGYVGSRGDHLVRPVDINQPHPRDVLASGGRTNLVRPFAGYGPIIMRETTARSRYHGLWTRFRHGGRRGTAVINYTLSRNKTDATFDNDTQDLPQNPLDTDAEFAAARTDRTHIVTGYYIYQLPFFRNSATSLRKAVLGGWQVAGITTIASGPAGRTRAPSGIRPDQVGDPEEGEQSGLVWFNPAAFKPAAPGMYGTAPVAPLRLPGQHQWDIGLAKNIQLAGQTRVQFRADFINAFNHTQFRDVNTSCLGVNTCDQFNRNFGRVAGTRAAREIQLGLRVYW